MAVYGDSAGSTTSSVSASDGPYPAETEEALCKLDLCEKQKEEFNQDYREGYFFTEPHRAREIRSSQALSPTKPNDAGTLNTGMAMELATDFVTEIVNGFMPQFGMWAEQKKGMYVSGDIAPEVQKEITGQDGLIFDAIRASNLYEVLPLALGPDISLGTSALWIQDLRQHENFIVQAVPVHELEINIGPYGGIDDRFVVRHTKHRHLKALLGSVYNQIDKTIIKDYEDDKKKDQTCILRWGYWREWDNVSDFVWKHVVMVDKKVVHAVPLMGVGSCPLLPFRFNPLPEWAFGRGPTIGSLPDLRQLDELEADLITHVGKLANPAYTFPDDSFSNIAGGVEDGKWYPVRPGSEGAIKSMFEAQPIEPAVYEKETMEKRLRRRYYLDYPQQSGDTPPTATQWVDQMQMALRRFGTPGATFWREGPAEIFLRFKHMLMQRKVIKPVLYRGGENNGKEVSLEPVNPAAHASEMEEVMRFSRFAELGGSFFPEEFRLVSDGEKTLDNVAKKLRVEGIWTKRKVADRQKAAGMISQLMGGAQPGAGAEPAATNGAIQ